MANWAEDDPVLERLIRFQGSLAKCLYSTVLVNHMSDILTPVRIEKIKRTKTNEGEIAAAKLLLDSLIEDRGHYPLLSSRLMDILTVEDHDQALRILKKGEVQENQLFEEVFELLRPEIIFYLGQIEVELLNHLMAVKCISVSAKEKVVRIRQERGNYEAASELLDDIKKLPHDWPVKFVAALRTGGHHEDLVNLLSDLLWDTGTEKDEKRVTVEDGPCQVTYIDTNQAIHNAVDDDGILSESVSFESTPDVGKDVNLSAPRESNTDDVTGSHPQACAARSKTSTRSVSNDAETGEAVPHSYDRDFLLSINANNKFDKPYDWDNIPEIIRRPGHRIPRFVSEGCSGRDNEKDDDISEKHNEESCKEHGQEDELKLRDYQIALAKPGLEGKNVVICAPTGSGKTHVAAAIMKDHLKKAKGRHKIFFLVNEVALSNQQCRHFKKFLSEFETIEVSSDIDNMPPIRLLLEKNDIIVLTAQLLVNAMCPKDTTFADEMDPITFDDFSMMIFDECHHTDRGHPYNILMGKYVDLKLEKKKDLPQVIGLTASLGVGKAKLMSTAVEHVMKMCANLDAQELSYPDEEMKKQIKEIANKPDMETTKVRSRQPDPFLDIISSMMTDIEKRFRTDCKADKMLAGKVENAPADKSSQAYTQWISEVKKAILESSKLEDLHYQRALKYQIYLKTYYKGLQINHECRTKDALAYLNKAFGMINIVTVKGDLHEYFEFSDSEDDDLDDLEDRRDEPAAVKDEEQIWLEKQFEEQLPNLKEVSEDPQNRNPMLVKLKEMILEKFRDEVTKVEGRGIIFVQTREMTHALKQWMMEDDDLKVLSPQFLVGSNAKDPGPASMTQVKQLNILQLFKGGEHKVLIATSVAEEGLDIRKCNWVIRYNYVTNEIAMVQSRGRARAEASKFEVLTGGPLGEKRAQKEKLNEIREEMMDIAVQRIKAMPREKYQTHIDRFQSEASDERKIAEEVKNMKEAEADLTGPYKILCAFCKKNLCVAEDLRKLAGTHISVLSGEFKNRFKSVIVPKPKVIDDVDFIGKIFCIDCNDELGVLAIYRGLKCPLLKIKCLVVRHGEGPQERNTAYRRWKDVPFGIQNVTQVELHRALAAEIGEAT